MNGSAVKASRRDIRKAFGPDALGVIQAHNEQISTLTRTANGLGTGLRDAREAAANADVKLRAEFNAILRRRFWGRVKWLVAGK